MKMYYTDRRVLFFMCGGTDNYEYWTTLWFCLYFSPTVIFFLILFHKIYFSPAEQKTLIYYNMAFCLRLPRSLAYICFAFLCHLSCPLSSSVVLWSTVVGPQGFGILEVKPGLGEKKLRLYVNTCTFFFGVKNVSKNITDTTGTVILWIIKYMVVIILISRSWCRDHYISCGCRSRIRSWIRFWSIR